MDSDLTPINARAKRRPPEAVEDLTLALREYFLWPIEDLLVDARERALPLDRAGRAVAGAAALLLAAAIGVGGFLLIASHRSDSPRGAQVAARVATPPPAPAAEPAKAKAAPTLHGAAPAFEPARGKPPIEINGSVPIGGTPSAASAGEGAGSAASAKISSKPAARAATSSASEQGPPAPPAALAVAREFAQTFVVYEVGDNAAEVREGFAETAAPALRRALLERPPRQPASVRVPRAKVLNVVPAPSHGGIYPVSVSLLRVGVTSELRLELEHVKHKGWQVVDALG